MMKMKRYLREIFKRMGVVAGTLLVVMSLASCELIFSGEDDGGMQLYESKAWLNEKVANYNQTKLTGGLQGDPDGEFKITITGGREWASFSSSAQVNEITGKVGLYGTTFFLYFDRNETASERSGEVTVKFSNGKTIVLPFSQWGMSDNSEYNRAWGEQPAYNAKTNYIHKTYYTTLTGQSTPVRNYSICYDLNHLVSQWVAYPIHSSYTGGGFNTRTDAWAFDDAVSEQPKGDEESYEDNLRYVITHPEIPQSKQQNIIRGSYGDSGVRGLNRGHMLPSASRYNTWMTNAQTFYATNMFPQNGTLNSGKWATLEGFARKAVCNDTLFCVVGTLYEQGAHQINSRQRTITVPSHCYKLLLRTKSGATRKSISEITDADQIIAIGFLFKNDATGNNVASVEAAAVSIAEIEERSGFEFFRNLDPSIAAKVKAQKNYDDWAKVFGSSK